MLFFRKIQKYVRVLLLFALLAVMYNNITNQHRHVLPNGQIIVHAHPFSKNENNDPQKKHTHNNNQLIIISLINNLFSFIILVSFVLNFIQKITKKQFILFNENNTFIVPAIHYQLRAPPIN
jgi:hypothetical protein